MNVLHLNTFGFGGGAARAALRLTGAERARGIEARLAVRRAAGRDAAVLRPRGATGWLIGRAGPYLDRLTVRLAGGPFASPFSPSLWPERLAHLVGTVRPDLVHLHWVGSGMLRVESLRALPCPIVWTLHDSWAFTGGCHLPLDAEGAPCARYEVACGRCPVLRSSRDVDLSRRLWMRKRAAWAGLDLTVVAPSRWLADRARASSLFRTVPVQVIPNGVDLARFAPLDRTAARRALGLPEAGPIVAFGAHGAADANKGFALLVAALASPSLGTSTRGLRLLTFGSPLPAERRALRCPVMHLGWLSDDESLRSAYAAADAVVVPSRLENLPFAVMEAMACGTPAVAFRQGGLPDLVEHGVDGYLAPPYDVDELARGIGWALDAPPPRLRAAARAKAERLFDLTEVARRYEELYRTVLAAARRAARPADMKALR